MHVPGIFTILFFTCKNAEFKNRSKENNECMYTNKYKFYFTIDTNLQNNIKYACMFTCLHQNALISKTYRSILIG